MPPALQSDLWSVILWCVVHFWPLLLGSPLVFLIREVRTRTVLRAAAGTVVAGSYLILFSVAVPALFAVIMLSGLDNPTNDFVINQDRTFAGIRFPKGSRVSTITGGRISTIVLSDEIDINGIPAGRGTSVGFGPDDKVGYVTTGRTWIYRGIPVPAGSTIFLNEPTRRAETSPSGGIYEIVLAQRSTDVTHVEDMLVQGTAVLKFDRAKLTALDGHYEWSGERYKSYRAGMNGQIQRTRE